jgi:hypothetical protein
MIYPSSNLYLALRQTGAISALARPGITVPNGTAGIGGTRIIATIPCSTRGYCVEYPYATRQYTNGFDLHSLFIYCTCLFCTLRMAVFPNMMQMGINRTAKSTHRAPDLNAGEAVYHL